jgi:hypothetical protein
MGSVRIGQQKLAEGGASPTLPRPAGGPTMQSRPCTVMVFRLELRVSGALGGRSEADVPSELSSFHGNVDGNLGLEVGRSQR